MDDDLESSISIDTKRRLSRARKKQDDYCPFDIPGVIKIVLSAETQHFIKCVVGDQVSVENPWTSVKKELLEEHMELDSQSEFHSLKEKIQSYGDSKFLIGWVVLSEKPEDWFYVVYTIEARDKVEKIVQRKKAEVQRKVDKLIYRAPAPWKNLGSDQEVNFNLLKTTRPLYQVELRTRFPLRDTKVTFKLKKVEEIPNGYIEILPEERFQVELVHKKRVDTAVQAIPEKITREIQTTPTYPLNIWTQYLYEYVPPKLEDDEESEIVQKDKRKPVVKKVYPVFKTEYMTATVEELKEHIEINNFIDIYGDDYTKLKYLAHTNVVPLDRISLVANFSNLHLAKSKSISHCVWNPFYSGLVATSYSNVLINYFGKPTTSDEVFEIVFGYSPVMIWSYTDTIFPKLFLETSRQVTILSFCPYDKNILVGGCRNGQIIVWDISGKLENLQPNSRNSIPQQKYKQLLYNILNWNDEIWATPMLKPILISTETDSQKEMITSIKWIPQNLEVTPNGKFEAVNSSDSKIQFVSTSLDGSYFFWDLNKTFEEKRLSRRKSRPKTPKVTRFKKKPQALDKQRKLKYLSSAIFTANLSDQYFLPISSTLEQNINYEGTEENCIVPQEFKLETPFLFGGSTGEVIKAKTVQIEDEFGTEIEIKLDVEHSTMVHDGPIVNLSPHPVFNDFFLSVGGTVFAIWSKEHLEPLIWKRAPSEVIYTSGNWVENPSCFILVRSDGVCELWDVLKEKGSTVKIIPFGNVEQIFGTWGLEHCRMGTFGISDELGALKILQTPLVLKFDPSRIEKVGSYFQSAMRRKIFLKDWMDKFYKEFKKKGPEKKGSFKEKELRSGRVSRASTRLTEVEKMDRVFAGVEWKTLQQEAIFKTMLELKNLNIEKLETFKQPLQEKFLDQKERKLKIELRLAKKHQFLKSAESDVLTKVEFGKVRKFSLPPLEVGEDFSYIEDYDVIEQRALDFIKCNEYKSTVSFGQMIENAREIKQKSSIVLKEVNIHERPLPNGKS